VEETKKKDALLWLLAEWKPTESVNFLLQTVQNERAFSFLVTKAVKQGYTKS